MGRVHQATKNIFFGYVGNIVIMLLGFIQRTVFIMVLDRTLLGVNGLYTDILSMLSLAELGIGTAINFSLYKPVAEHNTEKIKAYMQLYRKAYMVIAAVIAGLGLLIAPFLRFLISESSRGDITVRQLTIYYLIFLFNTVSSYFVAYKYSLSNAEQRNYIQTNVNTITKMVVTPVQIIVLLLTKNFLFYLLSQAVVELVQKVAVSAYLNHLYPYLRDKNVQKLSKEERKGVISKSSAWMIHKIGDAARLSTDSLIISHFINVQQVGVVGNYTYILNYATSIFDVLFNALISGFGNLVATESKQKQLRLFKVYRFCASWIYGYASVGFWLLLTPFIAGIWLRDASWSLGQAILTLILIDFYFKGSRTVLVNFKIAAGVFEQDKYLALIQGVVNLIISIWGVIQFGLIGVYIGTVISGVIANIIRPVIVYRSCFDESVRRYFVKSLEYMAVTLGVLLVLVPVGNFVMGQTTIFTFLLMFVIITIAYNGVYILLFHRTDEFGYLWELVSTRLHGRKQVR